MYRQIQKCAFVLSCFLLVSSGVALADSRGIAVSGTANIDVSPDVAHFSFAVNERGRSLSALKSSIDRKTAAVIELATKLGVETRYISSAEVSIYPQYNHQSRELIGYDVSRTIRVALRDLIRYTEMVNGAIDSGITTINNINLDVNDREKHEAEALSAAVRAARRKAEIIANNAGVSLGKILSIQEGGASFDNRIYQFNDARQETMTGKAQGAFEPGEISVSASVSVSYAIQ